MKDRATINITTFRGTMGATHWYGSLEWFKDGEYSKEEIKRPVTQQEIDKRPDRFYGYEAGDDINAFDKWIQVIEKGKEMFDSIELNCELYVSGIPNCDRALKYNEAINPDLDTRSKCSNCGHVFRHNEGMYNIPSGKLCCECYDKRYLL